MKRPLPVSKRKEPFPVSINAEKPCSPLPIRAPIVFSQRIVILAFADIAISLL
jgi:hypothetical protein